MREHNSNSVLLHTLYKEPGEDERGHSTLPVLENGAAKSGHESRGSFIASSFTSLDGGDDLFVDATLDFVQLEGDEVTLLVVNLKQGLDYEGNLRGRH
jgi:hypothetical protein